MKRINPTILGLLTVAILTAKLGKIEFNGHIETWYNLPMQKVVQKAHDNGFDGDYWERKDGCKMIGHYIICAGHPSRYGEIVECSRGKGIILDTGEFVKNNPTAIDLATTW